MSRKGTPTTRRYDAEKDAERAHITSSAGGGTYGFARRHAFQSSEEGVEGVVLGFVEDALHLKLRIPESVGRRRRWGGGWSG
jgi:hypothetical protein